MKKKPIYLYILFFFSTVGTLTSAVSTFGASKSFELTDDFAKQLGLTTAQDKADYVTYYFAGRPLLASFSTPSLRQRYLASSSIALLLLTALSLLFLGIVLYKTLRLRKAQARA